MIDRTGLLLSPALLALLAAVPSCAPSPLYSARPPANGAVTTGEIPRDARGEPVWSAIRPLPGAPQASGAPQAPDGNATGPATGNATATPAGTPYASQR